MECVGIGPKVAAVASRPCVKFEYVKNHDESFVERVSALRAPHERHKINNRTLNP